MNINIIKNIVVTFLFLNVLFSGTFYISESLDSRSFFSIEYKVYDQLADKQKKIKIVGSGDNLLGYFSDTNSLGYYHPVWKKRKIKYNVNLGFEYMQNDNFNFISIYTMLNYEPIKEITASFLAGLNFFDSESEFWNNQDYYPDSKGGQVFGVAVIYKATDKLPISLDYKLYTFSIVNEDIWKDLEYSRCAISLGYKF